MSTVVERVYERALYLFTEADECNTVGRLSPHKNKLGEITDHVISQECTRAPDVYVGQY